MELKIKSKRLQSGRYQVGFKTRGFEQECYGYVLAEARTSVQEVVAKIKRHVYAMQSAERYYQRNFYSLCQREINSGRVMVFKSSN